MDSWSKMNVAYAKVIFKPDSILTQIKAVAAKIGTGCLQAILDSLETVRQQTTTDEEYYKHNREDVRRYDTIMSIIAAFVSANPHATKDFTLMQELVFAEFSIKIAIIFNHTLLNGQANISKENVDGLETEMMENLSYFDSWKEEVLAERLLAPISEKEQVAKKFLAHVT